MSARNFGHGVLTGLAAAGLLWASTAWVQGQGQDARRTVEQDLARQLGVKVYSGADIGFKAAGFGRDTPMVVPVIKINGAWVEVQLGVPGIQKLTQ